jgi:hypothetical protein
MSRAVPGSKVFCGFNLLSAVPILLLAAYGVTECCQETEISVENIKRAKKYFEVMEKSGAEFLTDILKKGSKRFKLVGNTD